MSLDRGLIFLPLGGAGEIGMNANLYGCDGKWILCDLGMTFADANFPGVELLLPDLAFIEERRADLLGVLLTHGHEDHIGAIPYLAGDLGVPLFATPFTAGLIRGKLEEHGLPLSLVHEVPVGGTVELAPFRVRYVPMAHSIPEAHSFAIDTPYGRVFHTGDWKLDAHPGLGKPASAEELEEIGANDGRGVLALVGDSTNVFNSRESGSEQEVGEALLRLVKARRRGRVLVTSFASNAARLQTLGAVATATGRRLVIAGRALERVLSVGRQCGYLADFPEPLAIEEAASFPAARLLIVATGTQGEARAALARIAEGNHPVKLSKGDLVIYSAKAIPGNEVAIGRVRNALAAKGVEIVTERQARVHVSGHPGQPALRALYGWIRPAIAVPVHGERRHLEAHARLAQEEGAQQTIVIEDGIPVRLAPGKAEALERVTHGLLAIDGDTIIAADDDAIADRRRIGWSGHLLVTLVFDREGGLAARPATVARGLPLGDDEEAFLGEVAQAATDLCARFGVGDRRRLEDELKVGVRRVARIWTGKKPLTDVQIIQL